MITFIKSIIIGICALLPGVSGSVIAVSLGIYEKFLSSLKSTQSIKINIIFILEVISGILVGIFFSSNIVIYIFRYKVIVYYILSGIIFSEFPFIIKNIHIRGGKIRYITMIIAFLFSFILEYISVNYIKINTGLNYFIGGFLFSFGKIFPGVSSSFFLLCLGIYQDIIILVIKPLLLFKRINKYFPFLLGSFIGFLVFYRILSYLIKNKYDYLYSIILGFIISSTLFLIPKPQFEILNIIGFFLMIAFFLLFIYIKTKNDS